MLCIFHPILTILHKKQIMLYIVSSLSEAILLLLLHNNNNIKFTTMMNPCPQSITDNVIYQNGCTA